MERSVPGWLFMQELVIGLYFDDLDLTAADLVGCHNCLSGPECLPQLLHDIQNSGWSAKPVHCLPHGT